MFIFTLVRYQLLRNRGRTILSVCIAALLICCMSLYIGNIQENEAALKNLEEALPVEVRVYSQDGSKDFNLKIRELHFNGIMNCGVKDPVYGSEIHACWNVPVIESEPILPNLDALGVNTVKAIGDLKEEDVIYLEGWDGTCLKGEEAVCLVGDNFAAEAGIQLGDTVSMLFCVYADILTSDGWLFEYRPVGEQTLKVVGIYPAAKLHTGTPYQLVMPIEQNRKIVLEAGETFTYSFFRALVADPLNLNAFKDAATAALFGEIDPKAGETDYAATRSGEALVINDQIFIETAEKLKQNLVVLQWFRVPFYMLVIVMITLITFLVLRSSRREIAVAVSLGCSKLKSAVGYFLGMIMIEFIGSVLALVLLMVLTELTVLQILQIIGLFLACACVGIWIALWMLLRFDTMVLLTKVD